MILDAHNHLQDPRLAAFRADFDRLGVRRAVVNGTKEDDWPDVLNLAEKYDWIIPSFGLHPWFVMNRSPAWFEKLVALVDTRWCAIGEIGLDRWIENPDLPAQEEVFVRQLNLAAERNIPATIHCLKAWGRLNEILRAEKRPQRGFLLHSYSGPVEMVKGFTDLGAYFTISGHFAHPRKARQRETFRSVPMDRLLIETDAPDMPLPEEFDRFKLPDSVNHPGNIERVYLVAAELLGLQRAELESRVTVNFMRLFGQPSPSAPTLSGACQWGESPLR